MAENVIQIIGIELLAACQGIDFVCPLKISPQLEQLHSLIREHVAFYDKDRYFAPDIANIKLLIQSGNIRHLMKISIYH